MLIDVNAWCGRWPFAPRVPTDAGAIADQLAAAGVTTAHVASLEAVLSPDPVWEERQLAKQIAKLDMLVPSPVVHPMRCGWQDQLQRTADAGGKMVRLVPSYHGYAPDAPQVLALIDGASDLGLTVALVLRMEDERRHHPLMKVSPPPALAVRHLADLIAPRALLLTAAVYSDVMSYASQANLYFDLSFCEYTDPAANAAAAIGAERLCFGTHAPLLYPQAQRMKFDCSTLDDSARSAIATGNAAALLG